MPANIAMEIARAPDGDIQHALAEGIREQIAARQSNPDHSADLPRRNQHRKSAPRKGRGIPHTGKIVALTADEGLAGFALRRERVEFLLEPFRSAGGSPQPAALRLSIASPVGYAGCEDRRVAGRFGFNPKKSGPDHAVPAVGTTGFLGSTQHDQCRRRGRLAGWNKSGGSSTWIGSTLRAAVEEP
jgi:hypothetical protein